MLQCDKINVSEGIDINKKSKSKNLCFVITGILKTLVINLKHSLSMMAYKLKNIAN